jgi:hypothetical protein
MLKRLIKILKLLKCKVFICCGSKCSVNSNDEINISALNNNEITTSGEIEQQQKEIQSSI